MAAKKTAARDFVLEIGTEEVPSGYIESALKQLEDNVRAALLSARLVPGNVSACGTPRRLILYVKSLPIRQEENATEVTGPPKAVAFDKEGKPTPALFGFARKQGVKAEDLKVKMTERGEYVVALQKEPARSAEDVLKNILPEVIPAVKFPKMMRWEKSGFRFARPIRWILALYGARVIPFAVGGVKSSNFTAGRRFGPQGRIRIKDASSYHGAIWKAGIVADPVKRRSMIKDAISREAKKTGADADVSEKLLREVTHLVEAPAAFTGSFDSGYLDLPPAVLETSMSKNQRVFSLRRGGKLLPGFAAVTNGKVANVGKVRKNIERILDAKLSDSKFFFEEDTKKKLDDRIPGLRSIVFLGGLGSLYDKTCRVRSVGQKICEYAGLAEAERKKCDRALLLLKADLNTHIVYEFPDLQGQMGAEYARRQGEPGDIAAAIEEHYLPRFSGDILPRSVLGAIASVADKIDTITGCFLLGEVPSGSYDPHALRRQATGIVKTMIGRNMSMSSGRIVADAVGGYEKFPGKKKPGDLVREVTDFMKERLLSVLLEEGHAHDLVDSVVAAGSDDFCDTNKRVKDLSSISSSEAFRQTSVVVERVYNITKAAGLRLEGEVNDGLVREAAEKDLLDAYGKNKKRIDELVREQDYRGATEAFAGAFYHAVHKFFDEVTVNVEKQDVRHNRLLLLKKISELFGERVAGFWLLASQKTPPSKKQHVEAKGEVKDG